MSKKYPSSTSIFLELLAVLFIGLKLAGIINWSWWWVLAPLWIPLTVLFLLILGVSLVGKK